MTSNTNFTSRGDEETVKRVEILDNGIYDTHISAAYCGCKPNTMRNSRHSGKLSGVEAPAFIKMGTSVKYKGATLKSWRDQFREKTRSSENTQGGKVDE